MTDNFTVNFCAGGIPSYHPFALCEILQWITEREWCLETVVPGIAMKANKIARPGQQPGAQAEPLMYVYVSCPRQEFKQYFGFDYDIEKLPELPALIGQIEAKKNKGDNSGG